ncbi:MAG: ABC transporter ATP-binding protein [bacterium]
MEPIVKFQSVSKSYPKKLALEDVSFEVPKGVIFGCVGPNGAGKTTIVRLILGLLNPDKGIVKVFGDDPTNLSFTWRKRIAYVLETPCLYSDLTVRQNLDFFARIYGIRHDGGDDHQQVQSILSGLGIAEYSEKPAGWLSKGMKQGLSLQRAILANPDLLILDEPTSGLDPIHQRETQEILCSYRDRGGTVFLCSHHMTLIERLCEIVLFIKSGRSLGVISIEQLRERSSSNVWVVSAVSRESKQLLMNRLKQRYFCVDSSGELDFEVTVPDGSEANFLAFLGSEAAYILEVKRKIAGYEKKFFELMEAMDE